MTNIQLKALRQLLFYTVDEAAELVAASPDRPGGVTGRTWRHWEDGRNPVPEHVATMILGYARWRQQQIDSMTLGHRYPSEQAAPPLTWYDTPEEWATVSLIAPLWRPHQSALAHLAATVPGVSLVAYKPA